MSFSFNLKLLSFNCHRVKSSSNTLQQFTKDFDILMIQEHWLYPDELTYMSFLSEYFCSFSTSSMTTDDKLLRGRPHGGVSILWRKSLSHIVKTVKYDDNRVIGIELKTSTYTLLFLCCYLPYECDMFYDDYCFYLDKFKCIIESADTPYVYILGDFNPDIQSQSIFGSELIEFCDMNNMSFIDKSMLSPDTFTFISQAHGTTTWLDHCITTTAGESLVANVSVLNDIACSDHLPLCIDINCDINPLYDNNFSDKPSTSKWHIATDIDKQNYHKCTGEILNTIVLPTEALLCKDTNCESHYLDIEHFYDSIVSSIQIATSKCIPCSINGSKFKVIPGWNDYVKESYAILEMH